MFSPFIEADAARATRRLDLLNWGKGFIDGGISAREGADFR